LYRPTSFLNYEESKDINKSLDEEEIKNKKEKEKEQ